MEAAVFLHSLVIGGGESIPSFQDGFEIAFYSPGISAFSFLSLSFTLYAFSAAISRSATSNLHQTQKTHLSVCHLHLVEVEGVEPTSETESSPTSTSVVCLLKFPLQHLNKRSYQRGSFINTFKPQSFGQSVGTFYLPLCKARIAGAHITWPG